MAVIECEKTGENIMDRFAELTPVFFKKAVVFPGSLGKFRYRFQHNGKMNDGTIKMWVYEDICFEKAQNVEQAEFPWTEEGAAELRAWLNQKYEERMM
jgi:hypothetical protein